MSNGQEEIDTFDTTDPGFVAWNAARDAAQAQIHPLDALEGSILADSITNTTSAEIEVEHAARLMVDDFLVELAESQGDVAAADAMRAAQEQAMQLREQKLEAMNKLLPGGEQYEQIIKRAVVRLRIREFIYHYRPAADHAAEHGMSVEDAMWELYEGKDFSQRMFEQLLEELGERLYGNEDGPADDA